MSPKRVKQGEAVDKSISRRAVMRYQSLRIEAPWELLGDNSDPTRNSPGHGLLGSNHGIARIGDGLGNLVGSGRSTIGRPKAECAGNILSLECGLCLFRLFQDQFG